MSIEYFDIEKKKLDPTLRYRRYASTVTLNGLSYVIGGRSLGLTINGCEKWNPLRADGLKLQQ